MDSSLLVDVAGLRMHGRPGLGPYIVVDEGLEGWEDGVDMRSESVAVPRGHGSYALPRFQESRTVVIRGVIIAKSDYELNNYRIRLTGLLAGGMAGRVQVTTGGLSMWATAFLASKTRVTRRRGTFYADFTLNLWFPDPRKFGDAHEFRGSTGEAIRTFHHGNYGASSVIYVNGNMPGGYRLTCGGQTVTVPVAAVEGSWHSIDFRLRRLRINGVVRLAAFTDNQFWLVQPGQVADVVITPLAGGSGAATINVTDTYI